MKGISKYVIYSVLSALKQNYFTQISCNIYGYHTISSHSKQTFLFDLYKLKHFDDTFGYRIYKHCKMNGSFLVDIIYLAL